MATLSPNDFLGIDLGLKRRVRRATISEAKMRHGPVVFRVSYQPNKILPDQVLKCVCSVNDSQCKSHIGLLKIGPIIFTSSCS